MPRKVPLLFSPCLLQRSSCRAPEKQFTAHELETDDNRRDAERGPAQHQRQNHNVPGRTIVIKPGKIDRVQPVVQPAIHPGFARSIDSSRPPARSSDRCSNANGLHRSIARTTPAKAAGRSGPDSTRRIASEAGLRPRLMSPPHSERYPEFACHRRTRSAPHLRGTTRVSPRAPVARYTGSPAKDVSSSSFGWNAGPS